jgi:hypothetical protein
MSMRRVRCIDCGRISQRDLEPQELRRLERGAKLVCSDPNCRGEGVVFSLSDHSETIEPSATQASIIYCVECGEPIEQERLIAQPGTRYHARCHPDPHGKPRMVSEPLGSREAFKNERKNYRNNSR